MWNPFKKKAMTPQEIEVGELMDRVKPEIEANGGFVIIGLSQKLDGHEAIAAGTFVRNFKKSRVVFTVVKSLQMSMTEVVASLEGLSASSVDVQHKHQHLYESPITREDLKKKE